MVAKLYKFLYKNFLRPLLFSFEADTIHQAMLNYGYQLGNSALGRMIIKISFDYQNEKLRQNVAGIEFKNPVGLSAGFDKDADLINILPSIGFGYAQVGTVTNKPYDGNPQPWAYRLKKSRSILVNFGLKSIGAEAVVNKIKNNKMMEDFPLSISFGKTNSEETVEDEAGIEDYYRCLKEFADNDVGDFYTINISCPNTFGGEPFTEENKLDALLKRLSQIEHKKPVFLKMPINLSWHEFKALCDVALKYKVMGVVIGNLNKDRQDPALKDEIPEDLGGSVSGKPTEKLTNELITKTYQEYGNKLIIVGVGGIFSAEDAYEKISRGATLVQLITGLIYEGPQLVGEINQGLVKLMKRDGYKKISEAIGAKYE